MTEEEKKTIEYNLKQVRDSYELHQYDWAQNTINEALNLIQKQQAKIERLNNLNNHQSKDNKRAVDYTFELNAEIEKKDKIIDEMVKYIDFDKMDFQCSSLCVKENCQEEYIKQYFEKKVGEK